MPLCFGCRRFRDIACRCAFRQTLRVEAARVIWQRQLEELGGAFPVVTNEIEAWEEGTVGWASCKETITSSGTAWCASWRPVVPTRSFSMEAKWS